MAELADTVPVTVPRIMDSNWTGSYPTPNYTSIVMMHYTVKQLTVLKVLSKHVSTTFIFISEISTLRTYGKIVCFKTGMLTLFLLQVATLLLSVLGLIGNLLVVLVILSRRRWRFANSMFVLNIAIANLFICAFTLPLMTRALFEIE